MRFTILFFLVLTACLHLTLAQGSFENCCLKHVKNVKKGTQKLVESYRIQETDGSCNIKAVVFYMKNGRGFCAHPQMKWVKHLINCINTKNLKCF